MSSSKRGCWPSSAAVAHLRSAVVRLREELGRYPLAHASPFLDVEGRELVRRVQDQIGIGGPGMLVVVRKRQATARSSRQVIWWNHSSDGAVSTNWPRTSATRQKLASS